MTPTDIDDFLSLTGKKLEPGSPWNSAPSGRCDSLYKLEVVQPGGQRLGVTMETSFTPASNPAYTIVLRAVRPFWIIDFDPNARFLGLVASSTGKPKLGKIVGPKYFSWADNRMTYPEGTVPWRPQVARPLPQNLLNYKDIVLWLCANANIVAPNRADVFCPRGLK
jgi:hypothetical protein